jgi:hypothetical protein
MLPLCSEFYAKTEKRFSILMILVQAAGAKASGLDLGGYVLDWVSITENTF